jgi:spermidine synthase
LEPVVIKLDTVESEFGTITVLKKKQTGAITYEQGGCCQSEADDGGTSLAPYIHALFGLVLQSGARNAILIGCGGGTLATMLERAGLTTTIIDVNPASFVLARQYFSLPESVDCRVADGKAFLRSDISVYDAVILDAFHGDHIPAHLRSPSFYRLVRDRLAGHGALFVNVHLKNDLDRDADRIAENMSNAFSAVRILDPAGFPERNAIVMAGHVSHLTSPKLIMRPTTDVALIETELAMMAFRPMRTLR